MTVSAFTVITVAASSSSASKQPQPPLHSRQRGAGAGGDKRFTVRDGFHLKTRNDEKRRAIDQQLLPQSAAPDVSESQVAEGDSIRDSSGPSALAIPLAVCWKLDPTQEPGAPRLRDRSNNNATDDSELESGGTTVSLSQTRKASSGGLATSTAPHAPLSLPSSCTAAEAKAIAARLEPSSDWLIYRPRANLTPRRREQRVEEMVQRVLQTTAPPANATDASPADAARAPLVAVLASTVKESASMQPSRPRQPSLSHSTYHQRVLAARQQAAKSPISSPRSLYPLGELAPATAAERSLMTARELTNRDVDRLLVALFPQQPPPPLTALGGGPGAAAGAKPLELRLAQPGALKFPTRRSVLREQTAAALKSRNLVSRMDELRSLPQVLEQMVQRQREKRQQLVERHGQDLVLKNKQQSRLNLLQRPPLTPVFPSSVEQKQQQATRRKQAVDAKEDAAVRGAANRWQQRRQRRQDEARRTYHQCQWLLLTTLALSSASWLGRFQEWKLRRDALRRVTMARRIQAFWRGRVETQHGRSRAGYRGGARTSSSLYSRMPLVMHAVSLLQRAMRRWLRRKQDAASVAAVEVIVTSWLEFQDVKFRRLILRFRKRVRDFQVMWRAWRAITDARIKLLLLVWAKLEKRSKRRNGVHVRPLGVPESSGGGGGSALVHALQAAPQMSPEMRQKHLEGLHRHLKNGGTIHAPVALAAAAGAAGGGGAQLGSGSAAQRSKPPSIATIARALSPGFSVSLRTHTMSGRVKQNLEVQHQIGEDFQTAMQDFFAATATTSDAHAAPASHPQSPSRFAERGGRAKDRVPSPLAPPPVSWKALADAVGTPTRAEKVPLQLKVALLRQLLSEKRKAFQVAKDKKRMEWKARRQQMRRTEFRYNVLDEMVAYQRFEAEHAVFLVLHHVSEAEMLHAMHRAQQLANAAAAVAPARRPTSSGIVAPDRIPEHSPLSTTPDLPLGDSESAVQSPEPSIGIQSNNRRSLPTSRAPASMLVVKLLDDDDEGE